MLGGTTELWLNITYNYSKIYRRDSVFGKDGIEIIFGKTGLESIPLLEKAINALGDDVSKNYWEATEGNAKRPLVQLLTMGKNEAGRNLARRMTLVTDKDLQR